MLPLSPCGRGGWGGEGSRDVTPQNAGYPHPVEDENAVLAPPVALHTAAVGVNCDVTFPSVSQKQVVVPFEPTLQSIT